MLRPVPSWPFSTSPRWLAAGLVTLAGGERVVALPAIDFGGDAIRRVAHGHFVRAYDNVLGTSLDLLISAPHAADACETERRVLEEIERLRRQLSTYDSASEIRRVMSGAPVESAELAELLALYADWSARTDGLVDPHLGGVTALWRDAARRGRWPNEAELATAARDRSTLNVDALGKAFILDRATEVARRHAPGGLLNLGGDLRAWGDTDWIVSLADPRDPADNAPSMAQFALRDAAVATSGSYARFFALRGERLSHLINPRTLHPIASGGSATVVAADAVTANALATAAAIAGPETGAALASTQGAKGFVSVSSDGVITSGGQLASAAAPASAPAATPETTTPDATTPWPTGFVVTMPIVLKTPTDTNVAYRPYVVVWVENEEGRTVRTVTAWGSDVRWQRSLTEWYFRRRLKRRNDPLSTTRATRAAGSYSVTWDGRDDFNRPVPAGIYNVSIEISREGGHHVMAQAKVECGEQVATAVWRETAESESTTLRYGPREP